jgi:hypothetical protein
MAPRSPRDDSTATHGNAVEPLDTAHGAAMANSPVVVAHADACAMSPLGFAVLVILEACAAATGFAVSLIPRDHRDRVDA